MLGFGKLQVLESKIDIYEDLSKEMLDKLERAVTTISENSNKIAVVLERHENRLDESDKSDQLIIKMIEELRTENRRDHQKTSDRIDKIQRKVDQNQKFVIGVSAVLATLVTVLQVIPPIAKLLTGASNSAIVSEGNVSLNESLRRSVHQSNSFST
tara:strand:+ start:1121 stop:1588 length:468 start_codon:yes stop_codon:yes gene_type:complete